MSVTLRQKVVVAGQAQAVAQVGVDGLGDRPGGSVAEELDEEGIVGRRRDVGEVLVGVGPLVG